MANAHTRSDGLDRRTASLTVHVCRESTLVSWARRSPVATDLVLTPEQLHRRNLKYTLADAAQPRSSLRFVPPVDVAAAVAPGDADEWRTLDRTDRLRLLEELLVDPDAEIESLRTAFGTNLAAHTEAVEAAREELDVVAGGAATRADALREVAAGLSTPAARETTALLDGLQAVELTLADRTERAVSAVPVLRAGREALAATDGRAWEEAYPTVERLSVAGVSTVGSALLDFLGHVAAFTDVEVHLFLRAGTGPRIAERLDARLAAQSSLDVDVTVASDDAGGVEPSVPAAELVATTRREEARAAMAVVDALLDRGVSVSDVAVVARDVDRYERPLDRAARRYGRHLSVWTQLDLERTLPYRLLVTCGELLDAAADSSGGGGAVDAETVFAPLDCQWVPPDADADDEAGWPLAHHEVAAVRRAVDDGEARSLDAWSRRLDDVGSGTETTVDGVRRLIQWARDQPTTPAPGEVEATFDPVVEAYDAVVLPQRLAADTPDLTETSRTARAVERSRKLLGQVRGKYADWRDRGHVVDSWGTVLDVFDAVATTRPGRREHDNAERIDVLDATDTWLREYPYVVAVGLVDGKWPERPDGAFPPAFRDAVVAGEGPAAGLGVRGAWTEERERDHFVDAVRTATEGLVLTRFTEDADGVTYHRSPLLDEFDDRGVDLPAVEGGDVADLLAADRRLPESLRRVLDVEVAE
ncbi:hypothetical protein [Halospeciosus flavus]|uniref:Uncharacterized protein n=1 Tax=Halospeciosus flavus TaxID=3032283 RepID=A0ABD5Z0V9_9EURY|nr:hypothetical protein [Halospeciosus flavus]